MSELSSRKRLQQEFLAKAKDADTRAAQAIDAAGRTGWLKIAEGYRDLARQQELLARRL